MIDPLKAGSPFGITDGSDTDHFNRRISPWGSPVILIQLHPNTPEIE